MLRVLAAILLLQGAQIPMRDTAAVTEGSGVLRGRVTDKDSGMPLSGIVVLIPSSRGGQPTLEARTNADGSYEIRRVPAGSHILVALMPEYRTTHLPQVYGDTRPPSARWTAGSPARIDVRAGETQSGLDFVLVRAFGISGRVIDEAGQPMSNVRVRIESLTSADQPVAGSIRDTDDRGEFRVFGLAPGRYRVCAEPARFIYTDAVPPDAPATACYPAEGRNESPIVIGGTEPPPIQLQMRRGGTVTISGTILDAGGMPAEGASVSVGRRGRSGTTGTYTVPVWAGAQFIVRGVSPGEYFLAATGGRAVDNGQIERQYAYLPLTVGPADIGGIAITLVPPVDLAGRVTVEEGEALPAGTRLSVQARLEDRVASAFNRTVPTAIVRDDMTFELNGVLGAATIFCNGLPSGWIVKSVRYRGSDVTDVPFTPAADARWLDVVLSTRGSIVSGTVAGSETATTGRMVVVWLFPTDNPRRAAVTARSTTIARPDGTFTLQPVRSGEYYIVATVGSPFESSASMSNWDRLARVAERITLGEGDRRTIELRVVTLPEER